MLLLFLCDLCTDTYVDAMCIIISQPPEVKRIHVNIVVILPHILKLPSADCTDIASFKTYLCCHLLSYSFDIWLQV